MTDVRLKMIKEYVDTLQQVYLQMRDETDIDTAYADGGISALNRIVSFCTVVDELIKEVKNE